MVVLRAIGAFFARIGRWIRDTAWVQPLLIVGGIFAIIFSIKPISNAVSGWFKQGNEAVSFYNAYKVSMQGADNDDQKDISKKSDADKLICDIEEGNFKDGDKFFLSFVKEDCSNCEACYPGFNTLRDNWNKTSSFQFNDGTTFKMYTIFTDEKNSDGELLIDDLLINHMEFFTALNTKVMERCDAETYYYYRNMSSTNKDSFISNLNAIADTIGAKEEEKAEGFVTPTTYLFDFSKTPKPETYLYGTCTACIFNYTSDLKNTGDYDKAYFLRDCWKYEGMFSKDYEAK